MRANLARRFDRSDYERLSLDPLWSVTDAFNFAANFKVVQEKLFDGDYWLIELRKQFNYYHDVVRDMCLDRKFSVWGKEGKRGEALSGTKHSIIQEEIDCDGNIINRFYDFHLDVYFDRSEFLSFFCEDSGLTVSADLWASVSPEKKSEEKPRKLRDNQIDKLVCQGIAQTLWDIDSSLTIEQMIQHKAIQKYGNAVLYKKPETIKSWLRMVDPRKDDEKPGPNKKT